MFYRALLILLLAPIIAGAQALPDYTGIYPMRKGAPTKDLISSLAPTAKVTESQEDKATVFLCEWPGLSVKIRVDPTWDVRKQTADLKRWVKAFPPAQSDTAAARTLLVKLDTAMDCFGCIITPHFDNEGRASAFLLSLAREFDGFVFSHHSFYDGNGAKIIGASDDPENLQTGR